MTSILLIESNGTIKASKVKDVNFENLYKKGGFRSPNNFEKRTTWNISIKDEVISIDLWAKNDGKANSENKYDFPPPVDKELYFGTCILVRVDENDKIIDLTTELWAKIYERLFGGFEGLTNDTEAVDEEDLADASEEAAIPKSMKTKHGYVKDGFVVDDKNGKNKKRGRKDSVSSASESEDENYDEDVSSGGDSSLSQTSDDSYDSEEDEDYEPKKKDKVVSDEDDEDDIDIDGSELEEECYEYSDDEGQSLSDTPATPPF